MNVLTYANYPFRPYPPFREPEDWREATWRAETDRDLARIYQLVDDAGADHDGKHQKHDHPWCPRCTLRFTLAELECPPDLATEDHEAAALETSRNRCSRWMTLHRNPPRDDFDPEAATGPSLREQLLYRDQLADLPQGEPLIDGALNRYSYAILRGRDQSFKTFVALDWALCLATGKPWQGRPVERVKVLYLVGEGAHSMDDRVSAWEAAWGVDVDREWFVSLPRVIDLHKAHELEELLDIVEEMEFGLVIIDTLRRASGAADGNGSEMGVVVDNIDRIKRATLDGSVLVLTHTDKGDNDTRGFSGIEDDADIVWSAKREEMVVDLKLTKMKDGPDGITVRLEATSSMKSLILHDAGPDIFADQKANGSQRAILFALGETFAQTHGATAAELIEATGMAKSTFYDARAALLKAGLIESGGSGHRPRYQLASPDGPGGVRTGDNPLTSTFPDSPEESGSPGPSPSGPAAFIGRTTGLSGQTDDQNDIEETA